MDRTIWLFAAVYLATYAMSACPLMSVDYSSTLWGVVVMAVIVAYMLADRLQYVAASYTPKVGSKKTAVLIAGCDQVVGWQLVSRFAAQDMFVYVGVEDLQSETADWLRRHTMGSAEMVKINPESFEEDVATALRTVEDTLEDKQLMAVIYARHNVPKLTPLKYMYDEQKGNEVNADIAMKLAEEFAPLLSKTKGRFVMVADLAGRTAIPSMLPYCKSQAKMLQCANNIRKNLKKFSVSVQVVEPLLLNFQKVLENDFYPESDSEGKVIVTSKADKVDRRLFLTTQNVFKASLIPNPKARYLPSYVDYFSDMVIKFSPSFVHNAFVSGYVKCLIKRFKRS